MWPLGDPRWADRAAPVLDALRERPATWPELLALGRELRLKREVVSQTLAWLHWRGRAEWDGERWRAVAAGGGRR